MSNNIILDIGSGSTKVCFQGGRIAVFPSIVAVPNTNSETETKNKQYYVGNEALEFSKNNECELFYPIVRGMVTNEVMLQYIIHYAIINILRVNVDDLQNCNIFVIDRSLSTTPQGRCENYDYDMNFRLVVTKYLFNKIGANGVYFIDKAVASLFNTLSNANNASGIAVCSGFGTTYTVSVVNDKFVNTSVGKMNIAGDDVTNYLCEKLSAYNLTKSQSNIIKEGSDVKGNPNIYTALNFEDELMNVASNVNSNVIDVQIDTGDILSISRERFLCGEVLFKPSLLNSEEDNIVNIVNKSIMACGRNKYYACSNIVLVGGNANIKNFNKRLSNELNNIQQIRYNIIPTPPSFPIDGVNTMLKCDYSELMIYKCDYAKISESGDKLIDLLKSKCNINY